MSFAFPPPLASRRRGMTLAEVLATIAVMAIVIPVAMQGVSLATGLASVTRQRSEATALAEAKLNELVTGSQYQVQALAGDFGDQWAGYHWAAEVVDWDEPDMQQLSVQVTWNSRGQQRAILLSTLVYSGGTE